MSIKRIRERFEKSNSIYNGEHPNSTSQAGQDIFAFVIGEITKNKSYLEIGAKQPYYISNTRYLEKNSWTGVSIEIATDWKKSWNKSNRDTSRVHWGDALQYDYSSLPKHIGFLSCDIDPPWNINILALRTVMESGIQFDSICYEHNAYLKKGDVLKNITIEQEVEERKKEAEDLLYPLGYKKVINDACVWAEPSRPFEDWYVHESVDFPTMTHDEFLLKYEDIFWKFYEEK